FLDNATIQADGGNGANMVGGTYGMLGPGGGGGGGLIFLSKNTAFANLRVKEGNNGVNSDYSNNPWGAQSGKSGMILFGLKLPFSIDEFSFSENFLDSEISISGCREIQYNAILINNPSIQNFLWDFGDKFNAD